MGSFLILHGLEGSGPDHWQSWLASRLRERGERVSYPHLPDPFDPHPSDWERALSTELALLDSPVVLCHSLACLLWLHHVAEGGAQADRVLLVAPPSERAEVAAIASFFPAPLPRLSGGARLVCSDNDPYCPEGAARLYGEPLGIAVDLIAGGGHLNPESGYGAWPSVEAWCLDGDQAVSG
jgi:uncharacterized protein